MTKQEFENLFGNTVTPVEFDVINSMYMQNENESKQAFVERLKKMNPRMFLAEFAVIFKAEVAKKEEATARAMEAERRAAKVSDKDLEDLREWRQREKELLRTNDCLNNMLAEANQKHHDLVSTIAVSAHSYDNESICKACASEMGVKEYYRTLQAAGCMPNKADLDIFVEATKE